MNHKRRLKKPVKRALIFILILFLLLIGFLLIYKAETGKVNNSKKIIVFEVEEGSTFNSISKSLKKNNLIKSEFFYKIYVKLNKPSNLKEGVYELSSNMDVETLVDNLENGAKSSLVSITFKEGINFDKIAENISSKLSINKEDIYNKVKDEKYIDQLINKYWF